MNKEVREGIENRLADVAPEHLEGFRNDWLYIDELNIGDNTYYNIYTKEASGIRLIATYRYGIHR
jgi:hypothetical protein